MEDTIKKMIKSINFHIKYTKENFSGWDEAHKIRMAEIKGMISMLSIVTGKNYIITESGLKEK